MADKPVVIIVRKKKKVAGGHHGGAWKVAYADFVTAMMAFFLLLWLLNVTTDVERKGIADYFAPSSISKSESGAGGIFGGRTIAAPEAKFSDSAPPGVDTAEPLPPGYESEATDVEDAGRTGSAGDERQGGKSEWKEQLDDQRAAMVDARKQAQQQKQLRKQLQAAPDILSEMQERGEQEERQKFKAAETALKNTIAQSPELKALANNLIIEQTEEGLRIQIVDQSDLSMFPSGSANMYPQTRTLLELIGKAIAKLPNKLSLTGHTDSKPFSSASARDNWDLSAERANASRRALQAVGVADFRFQTVVGRADREPLVKENPNDPKNRRISIVLLRQAMTLPTAEPATPEAPAPATPGPATP